MTEKAYTSLMGQLADIWTLRESLANAQKKKQSYTENFCHLREYIQHQEQNVARKMNVQYASGEVSDTNGEHVVGNMDSHSL